MWDKYMAVPHTPKSVWDLYHTSHMVPVPMDVWWLEITFIDELIKACIYIVHKGAHTVSFLNNA